MATYRKEEPDSIEPLKSVREQIPANYDKLLQTMQQRNRRLRELRTEKQASVRTKERKEQGFSLYFSGANNSNRRQKGGKPPPDKEQEEPDTGPKTQRKAKTSMGDRLTGAHVWDEEDQRMKTAPQASRKGWGDGNRVKIKTQGYGVLQAKALDAYSEDFEQFAYDPGEEDEDDRYSSHSDCSSPDEDVNNSLVDKVTLSINDISQLRRSLMQVSVSQMIAEELDRSAANDAEVMEEIQEMLNEETGDINPAPSLKDTIVLEFQPHTATTSDTQTWKTTRVRTPPTLKQEDISAAVEAVQSENRERHVEGASGDEKGEESSERLQYIVDRVQELSASQQKRLIDVLLNIESTVQIPQNKTVKINSSVKIQLISNWGHPSKIGLTELQLFDKSGKKISFSSCYCEGVESVSMLDNLYDGKFKTTKERHMWTTKFSSLETLTVNFTFPNSNKPHKIVIWNYNKSLQDLDIGVRECRITLDNGLVFDGDLSKGCGNQVFDYGTTIMLDGSFKSKPTVVPAQSKVTTSNEVTTSPTDREEDSPASSSGRGATESCSSSSGPSEPFPKSSSDQLLSAAALYKSQESAVRHSSRSLRDNQSPRRSLASKSQSKFPPPRTASPERSVPAKPAASEEVTCSTDDDCLINKLKERKRVKASKTPTWLAEKELPVSKEPMRSRSSKDDDLLADPDEGRLTPMQKITAAREKRRKSKENILEQSWTSLNFFNRSQAGRISTGIEDDSLDACLALNQKTTRNAPVIEKETQPIIEEEDSGWSDEEFFIPELPEGSNLVINIRSTWGDCHYVGLTGIELFSDSGQPIKIKSITADPPNINILTGYGNDPRVITNIIDGVHKTRDDVHMWLTPFTEGGNHWIYVTFEHSCRLALMRFWNYNKSRIHSSRGARFIEVTLNNCFIFKGDIVRACGVVSDNSCETILFTMDDIILEQVSCNDNAFIKVDGTSSDEAESEQQAKDRPPTADTSEAETSDTPMSRPFTCAKPKKSEKNSSASSFRGGVYSIKHLVLNFTTSWGDPHYLGLTGLELLDPSGSVIDINIDMILAEPRDMTILPDCKQDSRTIDKLINRQNSTTSDSNMWMIPFTEGEDHTVEVTFQRNTSVAGIRLWNYNKSPEDAYRGAKVMLVSADGQYISPNGGYLLRKAPGHCHFDFSQEFLFSENYKFSSATEGLESDSHLPCGFIYQLNLFCAWHDQYYVGLNGLECFDEHKKKVELTKANIAAFPDSINALKNSTLSDVRTPEKLIDGVNDTTDGRHMWLAPILPGELNKLYIIFNYPVSLSMIRLWNYSKTPSRGVKDFSVLVDDLLIYSGTLPSISSGARGILPTCTGSQPHHTILFATNEDSSISSERNFILQSEAQDQDVMLTNDHQIVTHYSKPQLPPDQNLRPTTSVPSSGSKFLRHGMPRR